MRSLAYILVLLMSGVSSAHAETVSVHTFLRNPGKLAAWLRLRSKELAAASARVGQADADLAAARLIPNPTFDASLNNIALGQTNPPGLSAGDYLIFNVGLSETVELGKRGPRIASARLRREAVSQSYLDTLAGRAAEVRAALGRLVYLQGRQTALEENLRMAEHIATLEKVRMQQGFLSGNDYDRLMLDILGLRTDAVRNRTELAVTLTACRAMLLAPCDMAGVALADLEHALPVPADRTRDRLVAQRPDIRALTLASAAAQEDQRLARRRAIPDPSVRLGYTRDQFVISGDNANSLSLSLSIPLPAFDRGQHDAARARARAAELEHMAQATAVRAQADITALRQRHAFLERSLAVLRKEGLPRSASVLDTTVKALNRGQVSMTDLLLARRTHLALQLGTMDLRLEDFVVRNELWRGLGLDADDGRQRR
jgi:outer membrane protein, heavy metal efflux system